MLAVPREEAQERMMQWMGIINLVSALFLSGVAESALSPLDVAAMDPGKQTLGNIYNLISAANLAATTCNTLFTVYIMLALSTETQSSVLRVVASSGCLIFYEVATLTFSMMLLAMCGIQMWLQCTGWARFIIFIIFFSFLSHFYFLVLMRMFPLSGIHWQRMTFGFVPIAIMEAAQRQSVSKMMEAGAVHGESVVRAAIEKDLQTDADTSAPEMTEAWHANFQEMAKALEAALPETSKPRRDAMAGALLEEGFTLGAMRRSGSSALYSALGDDSIRVRLRAGEKLALCAVTADQSAGAQGAVVS
ncbi:hypothetical protein B484DRAFT_221579 [Ochromonadaceae sp. CCMP2298]|nr:hypothetical protein B484DRAFT_221579 [Ochromonadaceae sp. CCMP2298]